MKMQVFHKTKYDIKEHWRLVLHDTQGDLFILNTLFHRIL